MKFQLRTREFFHRKKTSLQKFFFIFPLMCSLGLATDPIAPQVESIDSKGLRPALKAKENFRSHAPTIRRGLIGSQISYRAESAQWFIAHGTTEDVPYLIDALSDESTHLGASYPLAGMAATRYWANVALIVICKTSYDFQWDAPKKKREHSISQWKLHWSRIKSKSQHKD